MTNEERDRAVAGASLSICESLLLALIDAGQLSKEDVKGLLNDAITANHTEAADGDNATYYANVSKVIETIRDNKNSIKLFKRVD